jgi:hypothetical protein
LNQNDLEHPDPENQSLHVTEQKRSIQSAHTTAETHTGDRLPNKQNKYDRGVDLPTWEQTRAHCINGKPHDIIPATKEGDSRFLFHAEIGGKNGTVLADTGCTAMIIAEDFVTRNNLKCEVVSPQEFRFANKTKYTASKTVTVKISKGDYSTTAKLFVCPISQDAILGTPWFEFIRIDKLEWREREMTFTELSTMEQYTWKSLGKLKSQYCSDIRRLPIRQLAEMKSNTDWITSIDIREIFEQNETEVMEITHRKNEHEKPIQTKPFKK